jgi:tetratricopeptide (TPR) repeat protein
MVNQYPDDGRVLSAFAQTLAQNGQHEAAVRSAQRAIRSGNGNLNPLDQYQMQLLLGKLLSQSGQLDQAIYHLDQAIQLMPNSIEPYLELGNAHQSRRQYRQALRMYEKAASIAPNDPRPHYLSGITYKEGKDYKNAESMFRRAATLAPNDVNIRRQLAAVIALNLVHNPKPVRISD